MGENFTDRHDRDRGTRSRQLDHVAQGLRDLRAVDEKVLITPIEEDVEAEDKTAHEQQNPEDRSDIDYLRLISRGIDHPSSEL